jgi:hypothetical protein
MDQETITIHNSSPLLDSNNGTLDESIYSTIQRDIGNIITKVKMVLNPKMNKSDILRDWDLWGPLLFCLLLAINLGLSSNNESSSAFTLIFVIIWCGSAIVTINSKLLGGDISFFQSICVLGYCIFPLVIASYMALLVDGFIKLVCIIFALGWSVYASLGFLSDRVIESRRLLSIYPIFLFYFIISWMILI